MAGSKNKIAVFDIDGTIFRSSLLYELVEALIRARIFPATARSYYVEAKEKWQNREGHYDNFIMGAVHAYRRFIKGVRRSDIWKIAEKVVDEHAKQTYRFTRDLVKSFRGTHFMIAISHSPFEIVAPFAKKLGFDITYAQVYEVDNKVRYTGVILYMDVILNKDRVLLRILKKNNLSLAGSVGVGDTESDIPFLKMVARPIAFNPSSKLYKVAKRKKWKIVVERKDVIYTL